LFEIYKKSLPKSSGILANHPDTFFIKPQNHRFLRVGKYLNFRLKALYWIEKNNHESFQLRMKITVVCNLPGGGLKLNNHSGSWPSLLNRGTGELWGATTANCFIKFPDDSVNVPHYFRFSGTQIQFFGMASIVFFKDNNNQKPWRPFKQAYG
jgi:hypothetical protein